MSANWSFAQQFWLFSQLSTALNDHAFGLKVRNDDIIKPGAKLTGKFVMHILLDIFNALR